MARARPLRGFQLFMVSFMVVLWFGMGVWLIQKGRIDQATFRRIEQEGRTVTGQIVALRVTGSKSRSYVIDYAFLADGVRRAGASATDPAEFSRAHIGDAIDVRYLPADPMLSHTANSIDSQRAANQIRMGWLNLLISVVYFFLIRFKLSRMR